MIIFLLSARSTCVRLLRLHLARPGSSPRSLDVLNWWQLSIVVVDVHGVRRKSVIKSHVKMWISSCPCNRTATYSYATYNYDLFLLIGAICIIPPKQYSTHFLNCKVLLAVWVICFSLSVPERDHPNNIRDPFGINNPDAIRAKVLSPTTVSALTIVSAVTFITYRHISSQCLDSNSGRWAETGGTCMHYDTAVSVDGYLI